MAHPVMSPTLRTILAVHAIVLGVGYAVGPPAWSSSGSFAVIHALGLPIPVWGIVFVLAGLLLIAGAPRAGHAVAAVSFGFWAGCLLATLPTTLSGWGGPVHYVMLALPLHVIGLWRIRSADARARTLR